MAHPKRRHSNARTGSRRAHDFLIARSLTECANCGRLILPHRICRYCGHYRNRQVVTIEVKTKDRGGQRS